MIIVVPARTPDTTPDPAPIEAFAGLLLLHTPPAETSVSVVAEPTQTVVFPRIAVGVGLTVTGVVT